MMVDIDSLTRRFGSLISWHCVIASILHHIEKIKRLEAYDEKLFTKEEKVKVRKKFNRIDKKQYSLFPTPSIILRFGDKYQ